MQQHFAFLLVLEDTHRHYQVLELILVEAAVLIRVEPLEAQIELLQEAFMLLQLKVKDDFLEVCIKVFLQLFVAFKDLPIHLLTGHFALVLALCLLRLLHAVFNDFSDALLKVV